MALCQQCRKSRKLKKGFCKKCRQDEPIDRETFDEEAMSVMIGLGLEEDEAERMLEDLEHTL